MSYPNTKSFEFTIQAYKLFYAVMINQKPDHI